MEGQHVDEMVDRLGEAHRPLDADRRHCMKTGWDAALSVERRPPTRGSVIDRNRSCTEVR
jgi:hypothetical protein